MWDGPIAYLTSRYGKWKARRSFTCMSRRLHPTRTDNATGRTVASSGLLSLPQARPSALLVIDRRPAVADRAYPVAHERSPSDGGGVAQEAEGRHLREETEETEEFR